MIVINPARRERPRPASCQASQDAVAAMARNDQHGGKLNVFESPALTKQAGE
jgi:hypothetical protein